MGGVTRYVLLLAAVWTSLVHIEAILVADKPPVARVIESVANNEVVRAPLHLNSDTTQFRESDLLPGVVLQGYELVERTARLGVCNHVGDMHASRRKSLGGGMPSVSGGAIGSDEESGVLVVAVQADKKQVVTTSERNSHDGAMVEVAVVGDATGPAVLSITRSKAQNGGAEREEEEDTDEGGDSALIPEGPSLEYQCLLEDPVTVYVNSNYRLKKKFAAGSHGEVWRATRRRIDDPTQFETFILKRLFVERGELMVEMGLREAHFGQLLAHEPHVTRFVEYFFKDSGSDATATATSTMAAARATNDAGSPSTLLPPRPQDAQDDPRPPRELWLVFYDEGISLRHYLYAARDDSAHSAVLFEPSPFWHKLRKDAHGENVLREILRQLLEGTAALHDRGITHRDIKPSNVLVHLQPSADGNNYGHHHTPLTPPVVKLADFGSAVDDHTIRHLYGDRGPTQAEETREYQPPEVLFSEFGAPYDSANPLAYDVWSIGVVFLEMVLGSPEVFTISSRARAKMDAKLRNKDEATKRKSYLLHVLTQEFCIFQPSPHELQQLWNLYALASDGCHFGRFNTTIVERDPMRTGLRNPWGLDLMWKLLQWNPSHRITARAALDHAFFQGAYICQETGREFATKRELQIHEAYLAIQRARDQAMAFVVREKYALPSSGFVCPHCRRNFSTIASCERHLVARKHSAAAGTFLCDYDHSSLRHAIRQETARQSSGVAADQDQAPATRVGVALLQGKKKYMEDYVVVHRHEPLQLALYAVIDGHLGTGAAEYVQSHLARTCIGRLEALQSIPVADGETRRTMERVVMRQLFLELHEGFLLFERGGGERASHDFSGCTLTVVVHFEDQQRLLAANVGDSRAVLVVAGQDAVPLSQDHWPNGKDERRRIESSGGFISLEGLWRVVGQLAVSRSIGDRHLRQYVTAEPSIFSFDLSKRLVPNNGRRSTISLVIASDGVWDTMDNHDVVRFVQDTRQHGRLRADVAADLVQEAFLRGSLDNLAAVVVDLSTHGQH